MNNSAGQTHPFLDATTAELSCVSVADRVILVHDLFERAMGLPQRVVCLPSMSDQLLRFQIWAARMGLATAGDNASRAAAAVCWEQRLQDSQQTATLHGVHLHLDRLVRALRREGLQQGSPVAVVEHFLSPTLSRTRWRRRRVPPVRPEEGEEMLVAAGWKNGPLRRLWHENNALIESKIQPAVYGLWDVLHTCEGIVEQPAYWADDEDLTTDDD
ncbi:hypothetical protein LEL_03825 [Akanthomyces lecanii RCEF 1005]|uniref:Uncharacterized protein n=1 Tax=Akanthomyces lecanii RCEF 1005 TaxID=1081108 RepID=A0A168JEL3_CORDF|nr:hypothetical protein LEL_03825 [Akanthomyces lecanii RCEF 1005]